MQKYWGLFWAATALVIVVAALAMWADLAASTVIGAGLGFVAFFWFVAVLTVPWNLYFGARQVAHRFETAREREIAVPEGRAREVGTLAERLLLVAIGTHVVSAIIAAAVALFTGYQIGYYVAGFFVATVLIRPAAAYFAYLRARIAAISEEAAYPPDDVRTLREQVRFLTERLDASRSTALAQADSDARQIDELRDDVRRLDQRVREEQRGTRDVVARDHAEVVERVGTVDQRVTAIAARFDAALDGITDQQEILAGLRAFARLMREEPR
ncbi:hypothetical protein ACIBCN_05475 [Nocardia sp. NPDC051052]|uniref:hypothetical protein n=1 Tax=Nocardia sp. NPDC051052 TaxID=3364322 RepID=UPI0037AA9F9F